MLLIITCVMTLGLDDNGKLFDRVKIADTRSVTLNSNVRQTLSLATLITSLLLFSIVIIQIHITCIESHHLDSKKSPQHIFVHNLLAPLIHELTSPLPVRIDTMAVYPAK